MSDKELMTILNIKGVKILEYIDDDGSIIRIKKDICSCDIVKLENGETLTIFECDKCKDN